MRMLLDELLENAFDCIARASFYISNDQPSAAQAELKRASDLITEARNQ